MPAASSVPPTDPPSEEVERVARAIAAADNFGVLWHAASKSNRVHYRRLALAALAAAGSTPAPPALDEVVAEHERAITQVIDELDRAEEWADRLAYAIAPIEVIGEHSSGNNPWAAALEVVVPYDPAAAAGPLDHTDDRVRMLAEKVAERVVQFEELAHGEPETSAVSAAWRLDRVARDLVDAVAADVKS